MAPPAPKRRRVTTAPAPAPASTISTTPSTTATPASGTSNTSSVSAIVLPNITLASVDKLFDTLLKTKTNTTTTTAVEDKQLSDNFLLTAASYHRQLIDTLHLQHQSLARLRQIRSSHAARRRADRYDRAHVLEHIRSVQSYTTPHLVQLAREETSGDSSSSSSARSDSDTAIVTQFLGGRPDDPTLRDTILRRLAHGVHQRAALEEQVQTNRTALHALDAQRTARTQWRAQWTATVATVERAVTAVGRALDKAKGWGTASSDTATGTTNSTAAAASSVVAAGDGRWQRLRQAQQLPAPLYTLFQLLQHALDERNTVLAVASAATAQHGTTTRSTTAEPSTTTTTSSISTTNTMEVSVTDQEVVLRLPVPDVGMATSSSANNNNKRAVLIHFNYVETPVPVIAAHATGCKSKLHQDLLLDQLFPHDHATTYGATTTTTITPVPPLSHPKTTAATTTTTTNRPTTPPPPQSSQGSVPSYQWSNALGGLYPIVGPADLHVTVRAILRELPRRVESNAILKHVLTMLAKGTVPVPPPPAAMIATATTATTTCTKEVFNASSTSSLLTSLHPRLDDTDFAPACKLATFVLKPVKEKSGGMTAPASALSTTTTTTTSLGSSTGSVASGGTTAAAIATNSNHWTVYKAIIRKDNSHTSPKSLTATIKIDRTRYPAIPPVWRISGDKTYDTRLEQLEHTINRRMIGLGTTPLGGSSTTTSSSTATTTDPATHDRVSSTEDTTYFNWILVHQLRQVMAAWDEWADETPPSAELATNHHHRKRKGRDRKASG